jgi:phosphoglycolate phosphatase
MTRDLRLVIFDVDGTLIDSQAHILAAMQHAFGICALPMPPRERVLSIVGLSLPVAFAHLVPDHPDRIEDLCAAYKGSFAALKLSQNPDTQSPFFPGALDMLNALAGQSHILLGIATGKSRRGLDRLLDGRGLRRFFQTVQCADDHPSKPHPSMVARCLADTGVSSEYAVIVGDTSFDIEMGRAAGIHTIGVTWGYHPVETLHKAGAHAQIDRFDDLPAVIDQLMGPA